MRARSRGVMIALACSASLLLSATAAAQQDPVGAQCTLDPALSRGSDFVDPDDAWRGWTATREAASMVAIADSIRARFRADLSRVRTEWRAPIEAALDSLREELVRSEAHDWSEVPSASRFTIVERRGSYLLFEGETLVIAVDDATPVPERVAVCNTALLARRLADLAGESERGKAVRAALARVQRWEAFRSDGYSMNPIELLVNSSCLITDCKGSLEPPRTQVVLFHPAAAFAWQGEPWRKAEGGEGIAFEWGGLLRYTRARREYFGVSFFTMYASSGATTNGVMLHVSKLGRLGVTQLRDPLTDEKRVGGVISADLFKLVEDGSWLENGRRKALAFAAACLSGGACALGGGRGP
jgi:hypothetical protein